MKYLRLKVCGLRDNIEDVVRLEPEYAGFIFYEKSPRYVGENFNMPVLNDGIKKVGVFVNESLEKVKKLVERYTLDYAQLHGNESPGYCKNLHNDGVGVIKAFPVGEEFDFGQLELYESAVDYYLFDTKTKDFGGSGETFNWTLLKKYSIEKEYFLSGGISLENVNELANIDLRKVHALDVNSRFEIRPGLKDIKKLKSVIQFLD